MLENNFVVSLLVLWPFLLQCSAQMHQLRLIPIPCDGFTRFEQDIPCFLKYSNFGMLLASCWHFFGTLVFPSDHTDVIITWKKHTLPNWLKAIFTLYSVKLE